MLSWAIFFPFHFIYFVNLDCKHFEVETISNQLILPWLILMTNFQPHGLELGSEAVLSGPQGCLWG